MNPAPAIIPAPTPRAAARLAGYAYVALFALAIFANFFVREQLIEADDAAATVQNIANSETLVRVSIVAFLVVFVLDVVVAWALYHLFRPAEGAFSAVTALFRIVYTVFLGVALVFLYAVVQLVGEPRHVAALGENARDSHVMLALDAFNATWLVGLTCFGVHLTLLGAMVLRSRMAAPVLGVLLVVAGGAYVFDTVAFTLLSTYSDHEAIFTSLVALPAVTAEAALTIWLLARAGKHNTRRVEASGAAAFATA